MTGRVLAIAIGVAVVTGSLAVPGAGADEGAPSREEYVAKIEPICEANTEANKRILKDVRAKVKAGKLSPAGHQFIRASEAFGATLSEISAVPRPPADDARLVRWFGALKIIKANLRHVGKALLEGDKIKATHETIRLERSGNAANNVGFVFEFDHCRVTPSRFT
jgi:hypothetical protein